MKERPTASMFKIDQTQLDKEWNEHSERAFAAGEAASEARLRYNELKAEYEVTKADIEIRIRNNPEKYGIKKLSEAMVKAQVIIHPRTQKMLRRVNKARYRLDIFEVDVSACSDRKKALENEVQLWTLGYFSIPRVSVTVRKPS